MNHCSKKHLVASLPPGAPLATRVGLLPPGWLGATAFQGTPAWGSGCFSKFGGFGLLWACASFLSVILRSLTLYLLWFVRGGVGWMWGSSAGRQKTPDTAGHSVLLTCERTNRPMRFQLWGSCPLCFLFRIYMRFALRSTLIPCTQRPLTSSPWPGLASLPAALCVYMPTLPKLLQDLGFCQP